MPDFCYTGDPRALAHDGEPDPPWAIPYGGAADTISGQLATIGLRPADVDMVVNSHLHLDHCGGNLHFAHCPLLLQAAELEAARAGAACIRNSRGGTSRACVIRPSRAITRSRRVSSCWPRRATPPAPSRCCYACQTAGSCCLPSTPSTRVRSGSPTSWGPPMIPLPREPASIACAVASQTGAQVVCGHDSEPWAALRHPPAYYD